MVPSFRLLLPLMVFVQTSHTNPVPQQNSGITSGSPFPMLPLFSIENGGFSHNKQGYPQIPFSTIKSHQISLASPQSIVGFIRGTNHQLQTQVNGLINGSVVGSVSGDSTSTLASPSTSQSFVSSMNPTFLSIKPVETFLQPGIANSLGLTENMHISPSVHSSQNGIIATILSNPPQLQTQNLHTVASYEQSSTRPSPPLSNVMYTDTVGSDTVSVFPASQQIVPNLARPPFITSQQAIGNQFLNKGAFATLSLPNYGAFQTLLNSVPVMGASGNNMVPNLQVQTTPGLQAQSQIVLPCTLHVPSPVALTVNPDVSQISTNLPVQQATVPSSFIDYSPPTIAILRPPFLHESAMESVNGSVTAPTNSIISTLVRDRNDFISDPKETESLFATTTTDQTKQGSTSQNSPGVPVQNNEPSFESEKGSNSALGLARNGLPIVYTMLPPQLSFPLPSYVSGVAPAVEGISNAKSKSPPTSRPTRGKNPFFNVNKRKHFEYYQYF